MDQQTLLKSDALEAARAATGTLCAGPHRHALASQLRQWTGIDHDDQRSHDATLEKWPMRCCPWTGYAHAVRRSSASPRSTGLIGSRCSALLPGEARPGSDLDLLVDFEPGASLIDHVGLFQDLAELLGVEVDVVARSTLKPRNENMRAEAVEL
jgi:predicted nucleotidyltransferase